MPQGADGLSGVQPDPIVRDNGEARHTLLPQIHDLLCQRELEALTAGIFLVEAPRISFPPLSLISVRKADFRRSKKPTSGSA